MFERYTERARRALFFARYEASEFGSMAIETEHVLLGLLRETHLCGRILRERGVSYASVSDALKASGKKFPTSVEIPFTEATKKALQAAAAEADRLLHSYIGTEHLLLGLLAEGQSLAASILKQHGLDLDGTRAAVVSLLGEQGRNEDVPAPAGYEFEVSKGIVYYAAASIDGFTATEGDGLAWLEPFRSQLEEIGYPAFYRTIDAMILGGPGYAHFLGFEAHDKPTWTVSDGSIMPFGGHATKTDEKPLEPGPLRSHGQR